MASPSSSASARAWHPVVEDVAFDVTAGIGGRPGRRVRIGQDGDRASRCCDCIDAQQRSHHRRLGPLRRPAICSPSRSGRCADVRGDADRHGLPGADDQPEPRVHRRQPDRRGAPRAPGHEPRARRAPGASSCSTSSASRRRAPAERLPAPVLRRHAPAGDDRDGARHASRGCSSPTSPRPRSTSPCRRRSSTCCGLCRRVRDGGAPRHPRPRRGRRRLRPGRGHVRRPGGGGAEIFDLFAAAAAPLHRRADALDPPGSTRRAPSKSSPVCHRFPPSSPTAAASRPGARTAPSPATPRR